MLWIWWCSMIFTSPWRCATFLTNYYFLNWVISWFLASPLSIMIFLESLYLASHFNLDDLSQMNFRLWYQLLCNGICMALIPYSLYLVCLTTSVWLYLKMSVILKRNHSLMFFIYVVVSLFWSSHTTPTSELVVEKIFVLKIWQGKRYMAKLSTRQGNILVNHLWDQSWWRK